ncbi:hypothetical protein CYMTET_31246, partial [Cymbomonas tetramitiformis]
MNCLTKIPTLLTISRRMRVHMDNNCSKIMSMVTGLASIVSVSTALASFHSICYSSMTEDDIFRFELDDGTLVVGDASYNLGTGYLSMWLAIVLTIPTLAINILMPVPRPEDLLEEEKEVPKGEPEQVPRDNRLWPALA